MGGWDGNAHVETLTAALHTATLHWCARAGLAVIPLLGRRLLTIPLFRRCAIRSLLLLVWRRPSLSIRISIALLLLRRWCSIRLLWLLWVSAVSSSSSWRWWLLLWIALLRIALLWVSTLLRIAALLRVALLRWRRLLLAGRIVSALRRRVGHDSY